MQYTTNEVVPKIGLDFEEEKELYQVKIELNNVRHLVLDISCLDRDLDLRLMLFTKRTRISPYPPKDPVFSSPTFQMLDYLVRKFSIPSWRNNSSTKKTWH
ncbi:hypothetical protein CsSME_00027776 [Camellia sinensis var. sinensis]